MKKNNDGWINAHDAKPETDQPVEMRVICVARATGYYDPSTGKWSYEKIDKECYQVMQ